MTAETNIVFPASILKNDSDNCPENLCSQCKNVLRNPKQTGTCYHRFCGACVEFLPKLDGKYMCLHCKESEGIDTLFEMARDDRAKKKEMRSIPVGCIYKGCKDNLTYGDLENHIQSCAYKLEPCALCHELITKRDKDRHKDNCPKRIQKCYDCGREVQFDEFEKHRNEECNKSCPHCDIKVQANELEYHIANICVSSWVLARGCPFKCRPSFNTQDELDRHREQFRDRHLDKLNERIRNVEERGDTSDELVSRGTRRSNSSSSGASSSGNNEAEIRRLRMQLEELINDKVALDLGFQQIATQLAEFATTSFDGKIVFPINKFTEKKNNVTQQSPSIYSPPFYVGRYGYKLCLRVFLNGEPKDPASWDRQLGIHLVVLQGEFDNLLRWPFQERTKIVLRRPNRTVFRELDFPIDSADSGNLGRLTGFGTSCFASLDDVRANLVDNDTLIVEAAVDCSLPHLMG